MKLGDCGVEVNKLIVELNRLGCVITEDYYGPQVKQCVVDFQNRLGLNPTGVWEDEYWHLAYLIIGGIYEQ